MMMFDTVIFDDELTALSKPKAGTGFAKYIKPKGWRFRESWQDLIDAPQISLVDAFFEEVESIWGDDYIARELLRSTPNDKPNPLYAATTGIVADNLKTGTGTTVPTS